MAGKLTLNAVQLGDSTTDSQNFLLKTNADGTGKLARGSAGNLGDILAWDANGKLTLSAVPAAPAQSMIRLNTSNGYGSTNTVIKRYTTAGTSQGTDITYTDSATLGASFTVNVSGLYAMTIAATCNVNSTAGFSINSAQLSTSIYNITPVNRLSIGSGPGGNVAGASYVGYFVAGDVIRPHGDGQAAQTATTELFTITRVA